ncbi:MAG TPA: Rieske 2Fe-2S domain-containing protein [Bacteroidota bacterium]|nr:Rieske 2Fe-2S domain-containing protein [Bacteroidota bacterium]
MDRRAFIKSSCSACLLAAAGSLPEALLSCAPGAPYEADAPMGLLRIPESIFQETTVRIIRARTFDSDIALEKLGESSYRALILRCTHADNELTFTGSAFNCSLHGSTFDLQGTPTRGPARLPLRQLPLEVSAGMVTVHLPAG